MDVEQRLKLILRKPTEEVLTVDRLKELLEKNEKINHYIGFEISGFVHLGTGIVCMSKVADFQKAGINTTIFLADLHAWINKKLGGDLSIIRKVAKRYFSKALELSLKAVGGDIDKVNIVLGSELYEKLGLEYLENILKVSKNMTLSRALRSITIMGRKLGEKVNFAQLVYVPMQVADLFSLKVNLAHGGMDQRKAHVIALEVWKEFGYKPVAIHHYLILGIHITEEQRKKILEAKRSNNRELFESTVIELKMSKSKPETCIFIHDTEEDIRRKIMRAYCPFGEVEVNPVWDIFEYVIYPWMERNNKIELEIENEKSKEVKRFDTFEDLKKAWINKEIHPLDFKKFVADKLIEILEPARKYFLEGAGRKYYEELKNLKETR